MENLPSAKLLAGVAFCGASARRGQGRESRDGAAGGAKSGEAWVRWLAGKVKAGRSLRRERGVLLREGRAAPKF